ncbi:MAG: DUF1592 domain-containing protein [Verrucomicrobiia bacterium]|jgi:hypothetical protein
MHSSSEGLGVGSTSLQNRFPKSESRPLRPTEPIGSFRLFTKFAVSALVLMLALSSVSAAALDPAGKFLKDYCVKCHGADKQKADRRFDTLSGDFSGDETLGNWQDILDQLNLGEMPPEKSKQPSAGELKQMVAWVTSEIAWAREAHRGRVEETVLRRLNRREYRNTIRDLFGFDMTMFDPTKGFPEDDEEEGFDNLGETLVTSEHLLGRYLDAADVVIEKAIVAEEKPRTRTWKMKPPFDRTTDAHSGWVTHERRMVQRMKEPFQTIFQGTKERFGYRPLDDMKEGVPEDGFYTVRVKACGLHREHEYDRALIGTDPAEPIRLALVSGSQAFGTLHLRQSIEQTLAVIDLPDDKPEWREATVWLDKGFQPRMTYENGPYFFKTLPNPIHRKYPDKFPIKLNYGNWWDVCQNIHTPQLRVYEVEVKGPIYEQWPPAGHRRILGGKPFSDDRASEVIGAFATRAFRRPARADEVASLKGLYDARRKLGEEPIAALKASLKATLCSPSFLYLEGSGVGGAVSGSSADGGVNGINSVLHNYALASRLSYFLWSSMPDETLLQLAATGDLAKLETLRQQTRRMLADPRATAFSANFTDRWLKLYKLGEMPPDSRYFKSYYVGNLETAMAEETHRYFQHLLDGNLDIGLLLDSDFTFVNRPLARHYGIDTSAFDKGGAHDRDFIKVALRDRKRGGLLGHASVLTVTANGIDTSPVIRGVWTLENILGQPPSPPPPDVEPLEPDIRGAKSIRDQLKKHRENPTCFECHRKIDPLGFALEEFDAIGGKRRGYGSRKTPIDTSGVMPDGRKFKDVAELKKILLSRKPQFARNLTEKLLTYATGRRMNVHDRPHIDRVVERLERDKLGLRDLVLLVVESDSFLAK